MARTRAHRGLRVLLRVAVTAITLVLAGLVAVVHADPSPDRLRELTVQTAERLGLHDAVIENSSASTGPFTACRDWADDTCKDDPADRRELAPGTDTRTTFAWKDADGLYVAAGCSLQITGDHRSQRIVGPQWFKVIGLFGLRQDLTYTCER